MEDKFILGAIESPVDLRDYDYKMVSCSSTETNIPDNYILDYDYPILNQGTVGSCVAHALSCMKSYIDGTSTDSMYSVGFIYANRQENDFQGTGMITREAFKNLIKYGDCTKKSFPVNEEYPSIVTTLEKYGKDKLLDEADDHKSLSYIRLDIENIKEYLFKYQKPVLITVRVYENFYNSNINGGIIPKEPNGKKIGGHALLCIGYKEDTLILINSWGDYNGDKGKYYLDINSSIIKELWVLEDEKNVNRPLKKKYTVGWNKDSKGWWYSPDGLTYYQSDWKQLNGNWFRFDSKGYAYQNCWFKYEKDGKWYYFDDNCYMVSNKWIVDNNKWYRLGPDGAMITRWFKDSDGLWYYLDIDKGYMYSNCRILIDGKYYSFNTNGAWVKDGATVSDLLINNTKKFEGFYSYWYYGDGTATIGYGTSTAGSVGKKLKAKGIETCTKEQAFEWLKEEMQNGCQILTDWLNENNVSLSQNQFDACVDVLYNMGFANFKKFGIADIVLGKKANTWNNWRVCITDINGVEYPGLITRRWSEFKMYTEGDYSVTP